MSGRIVVLADRQHRCPPEEWSLGLSGRRRPAVADAPMGSVWRCDCGRAWKRAPRPFAPGQRLTFSYWRRERPWEALARRWRGRA